MLSTLATVADLNADVRSDACTYRDPAVATPQDNVTGKGTGSCMPAHMPERMAMHQVVWGIIHPQQRGLCSCNKLFVVWCLLSCEMVLFQFFCFSVRYSFPTCLPACL